MAQMKLAGSEVHLEFSDTFRQIAEDENLEQRQKARMLEQMESTWDDIEVNQQGLGFDDLSLEVYRQELLEELNRNERFFKNMPKGVYTGFQAQKEFCPQDGLIALMGYPSKPPKAENFRYKGYELIYINYQGEPVFLNQKEVLDAIAKHKENPRFVSKAIDHGESDAIGQLSDALGLWLKKQAVEEELQEDGSVKQKMGKAALDLINKLKSGGKETVQKIKTEGNQSRKFDKDNVDLITWFVVS
jgi:hypothetical protein